MNLDADATDPDRDTLTYSASGLPAGVTIDPATGVISGTWRSARPGHTTSRVTVSDGILADADTFRLTVRLIGPGHADRPRRGRNGAVELSWTANSEPDLAGYSVYRSTSTPVDTGTALNGATLLTATNYTDTSAERHDVLLRRRGRRQRGHLAGLARVAAPSVNAGTALQLNGSSQYVTFGAAPASRRAAVHARAVVPAHRRRRRHEHRHRRHRERHPARDEGPRRGRGPERRHELLPRHRRDQRASSSPTSRKAPRAPPGSTIPVIGQHRGHAATSGTTRPRPTTARPGGCTWTASWTARWRSASRRGRTASSTPRSAAR